MSEEPPGRDERQPRAPHIDITDGVLRAAAWQQNGKYGSFYNSRITRRYANKDGEIRETSTLRERDLLPSIELTRRLHDTIIRERRREHAQERPKDQSQARTNAGTETWHDDTKTRAEIKREGFKKQREQGTRRRKPRDREAR